MPFYIFFYNLCKLFGPHVHAFMELYVGGEATVTQRERETVGQIIHDDLTSVPSTCSDTKNLNERTENVKSLHGKNR